MTYVSHIVLAGYILGLTPAFFIVAILWYLVPTKSVDGIGDHAGNLRLPSEVGESGLLYVCYGIFWPCTLLWLAFLYVKQYLVQGQSAW